VFELLARSPKASRDFEFATQLRKSARGPTKHIAEGFLRKSPAAFIQFLDYAISSLGEAEEHLDDGVENSYFAAADCRRLRTLCRRARQASLSLKRSQERYLREQAARRQRARSNAAKRPRTAERQ
jgi:four helix bundle protein